ncbi:MAG: hypothetical protein ABI640_06425 [Gammaproteobacteria bacterium]
MLAPTALIAAALVPAPATFGGELIKPTLNINDMRLVIAYISPTDLLSLQQEHGAHVDMHDIRLDYRHGFSILKTNRETGARTCEIYLPNTKKPRAVDDEATLSLGHEVLHCMLGKYHR